ncbi:hypothetical protein BBJ28_00019363 [Nothophytophthora sp. Chile5]|nr:hypothetical protein BBJ28_00019363 [Nothophytophthora sp. Chile5]
MTALRGEIAAAVARGDGYKTSFNSTMEQRKTDNAHNAQRYSILGKNPVALLLRSSSELTSVDTSLNFLLIESQLTESIAESDSLRDIVTHMTTMTDLTSQAEAAATEVMHLRDQLQVVLDDSELQRGYFGGASAASVTPSGEEESVSEEKDANSSDNASGSDGESDYGVAAGPVTGVEDAPTPTTPVGYTLMSIDPFFGPCLAPRIDSAEWDANLDAYQGAARSIHCARDDDRRIEGAVPPSRILNPPRPHWQPPSVVQRSTDHGGERPTRVHVEAVTRVLSDPITFAAGDHAFQEILHAYWVHLSKWAQSYWESTHALPLRLRSEQYFVDLVADI